MKFIIPFNNEENWEKGSCPICKQTDKYLLHILEKQKKRDRENIETVIKMLELGLVDGYNLFSVPIKRKKAIPLFKTVDRLVDKRIFNYLYETFIKENKKININTTYSINFNDLKEGFAKLIGNVELDDTLTELIQEKEYNFYSLEKKLIGSDDPVLIYSRWCKFCGARKLDIYDTLRNERLDLLPITNFFCVLKNRKVYINWVDSKSFAYKYSKLFNGSKELIVAKYNEYKDEPFTIDVEDDILYTFYVINYDKDDKIIARSQIRFILNETNNEKVVLPVNDLSINQETILVPYRDKGHNYEYTKTIVNNNLRPIKRKDINNKYVNEIIDKEEKPIKRINLSFIESEGKDTDFISLLDDNINDIDLEINGKNKIWRWVRKNVIVTEPVQKDLIIRRSIESVPNDIDVGINCDYPFQEVEEGDLRKWFIKVFPVSKTYAKRILEGFQFYRKINYESMTKVLQLTPLITDCTDMKCVNRSKRVDLTWTDPPFYNWSKTQIYMREYNGMPIWRKTDAELIAEVDNRDLYRYSPFELTGLINGKNYQLGIFPVSYYGVTLINPIQLIGKPRYIRPSHFIDDKFIDSIKQKIRIVDKNVYRIDNDINIGSFYWNGDKFTTTQSTIFWFETEYPVVEGGILSFEVYSNYPCVINVYSNHANIFTTNISTNTLMWEKFEINVSPLPYCKLIIDIACKYSALNLHMRNVKFEYKTGEEKFI